MILLGCCLSWDPYIPAGATEVPESNVENFVAGCRHILASGFDFVECTVSTLMNFSEEELTWLEEEMKKQPLPIRSVNCLFVNGEKLSDPGESWEDIKAYVIKMIDLLARLHVPYAVFGSGGARSFRDVDRETCVANLCRLFNHFADYGEKKGVTLVLEPLRDKESNLFNTLAETYEIVRHLNRPGVRLLADSYHMAEMGCPADDMLSYMDTIQHCHIAEAPDRTTPGTITTGDKEYNVRFADALIDCGYTGGVSVECLYRNFWEELPAFSAYMNSLFRK